MEVTLNCLRCKGQMQKGFVVENRIYRFHSWTPGQPQISSWFGSEIAKAAKESLRIMTYRCTECGYLESYAK